jgi:hypothetical protein
VRLSCGERKPCFRETKQAELPKRQFGFFIFWVNDGTGWQTIQDYSTANSYTWAASTAGGYIVVVRACDTEAPQSSPIAGWSWVAESSDGKSPS